MSDLLQNRIILVTGSTQGIGRAVAETCLQAGARVVISSRVEKKIAVALQELSQYSGKTLGFAADLGQPDSINQMIEKVLATWGPIDILVNNAGTARFMPVLETCESDWDEMMRNNLKGAFLCTRAVLPEMIKRKSGHILFITSVAAIKAFPNCAAYSASKAGVLALANVLREEIRQTGIRVTAIIAGATNTPLWDGISGDFPRNRMMTSQSIANVILAAIQNTDGMVEEIIIRPLGGDL